VQINQQLSQESNDDDEGIFFLSEAGHTLFINKNAVSYTCSRQTLWSGELLITHRNVATSAMHL